MCTYVCMGGEGRSDGEYGTLNCVSCGVAMFTVCVVMRALSLYVTGLRTAAQSSPVPE